MSTPYKVIGCSYTISKLAGMCILNSTLKVAFTHDRVIIYTTTAPQQFTVTCLEDEKFKLYKLLGDNFDHKSFGYHTIHKPLFITRRRKRRFDYSENDEDPRS